ncbi:hypothetical protein Acsp01_32440 [Actinoplanes sp. NBRC 101535]|nr:hypothetical protein Acsp01_32440 [Actinoplanes sp. NBRC 101535]
MAGSPAAAVPAPPPLLQGWLVTGSDPARCLTGGPNGDVLITTPCDPDDKHQEFFQASDGTITNFKHCFEPSGSEDGSAGPRIVVAKCTFTDDQDWWFNTTLRLGRNGDCLTEVAVKNGKGEIRLRPCTGADNQKWQARASG